MALLNLFYVDHLLMGRCRPLAVVVSLVRLLCGEYFFNLPVIIKWIQLMIYGWSLCPLLLSAQAAHLAQTFAACLADATVIL